MVISIKTLLFWLPLVTRSCLQKTVLDTKKYLLLCYTHIFWITVIMLLCKFSLGFLISCYKCWWRKFLPCSRLALTALNGFLKQLVDVVQGAFKKKSLGFMWLSMCLHDVDLHLINHLLKLSVTMATAVITSWPLCRVVIYSSCIIAYVISNLWLQQHINHQH